MTFQIASRIFEIKSGAKIIVYEGPPLYNYQVGLDLNRHLIYTSVEVWPDCLDRGKSLTYESKKIARCEGIPGDKPACLISRKLGGCKESVNAFPLNESLDTSQWKEDENRVYEFVKQGGSALLQYAIEFCNKYDSEIRRPHKIYYKFDLYEEDSENPNETIEGLFENVSPRKTNKDFYC